MKKGKLGILVVLLVVTVAFTTSCTCRDKGAYNEFPVGVIMADADGKIIVANDALQKMIGYTLKELQTKSWQEITPPKWHGMQTEMLKIAIDQPYIIFQKAYIKKDGSILPIQVIGWAKKDAGGKMIGSGGIIWPLAEESTPEVATPAPKPVLPLIK